MYTYNSKLLINLSLTTVNAYTEKVKYSGYDALAPFKTALQSKYFPYTYRYYDSQLLSMFCQCPFFSDMSSHIILI